jgi:chorismate-pyruvate lyase
MRRLALALSLLLATPALAQTNAWPDDFQTRLAALALVQTLNGAILASTSATISLETWCGEHRLAPEPRVAARLIRGVDKPASDEQRRRLGVGQDEIVNYRRVQLVCGDKVLSEADNWYVPARLTQEMNRVLETTDTPFGRAVLALKPYRQTFAAEVLWWPLPPGWEMKPAPADAAGVLAIPEALFEHRAVLFTAERVPFSEVREVYQKQLFDFPPPRR